MGYENDRGAGGAAVAGAIIVALLLLGLLVVIGGGFFAYRANMARQQAMVQAEKALLSEMEARKMQEMITQELKTREAAPNALIVESSNQYVEWTLSLDDQGRLLDESPQTQDPANQDAASAEFMTLDALQERLANSQSAGDLPTRITIRVAPDCAFRHLSDIITACREAGVTNINMESSTEDSGSEDSGSEDPGSKQ